MAKPAIQPVIWRPPPRPSRARKRRGPEDFPLQRLPLPGRGPEEVVVEADGTLLTGVQDGRVLRVDPVSGAVATVADTGGRPLGLHVLDGGLVLVCDADRGLLRLDPRTSELKSLAAVPFASNATAHEDGSIYFTSSSTRFGFDHWMGDILEHSCTGRLLRLDPDGTLTTLANGLCFANGVVLTPDRNALIVAETGAYRLVRHDLATGSTEVFADNLPGAPDNLAMTGDGRLWVALVIRRDPRLDLLLRTPPILRRALWAVPDRLRPPPARTTWVAALSLDGRVLRDLQRPDRAYGRVTGMAEHDGRLYLGSLTEKALAVIDLRRRPAA
ncbi:SMP-30/gluconolactonase/LRE family protein [Spirillospora sp. NPDC047279]|uniref:SMP-30/gluconolactonase/LRE family protein n=1 Tax=Spirillospora sp. NPDC047279 TaxID=3155478 RepID=UPI0033CE5A14